MLYNDIDARRLVAVERQAQLARDATRARRSGGDDAGRRRFALTRTVTAVASKTGGAPLRTLARIVALVVPFAVAAVLALPAEATQPQAVQLELVGRITGPDSIAGMWSSTGVVGDTVHVEKTLIGSRGTIALARRPADDLRLAAVKPGGKLLAVAGHGPVPAPSPGAGPGPDPVAERPDQRCVPVGVRVGAA
jgi:hypothetical protein